MDTPNNPNIPDIKPRIEEECVRWQGLKSEIKKQIVDYLRQRARPFEGRGRLPRAARQPQSMELALCDRGSGDDRREHTPRTILVRRVSSQPVAYGQRGHHSGDHAPPVVPVERALSRYARVLICFGLLCGSSCSSSVEPSTTGRSRRDPSSPARSDA